MPACALLSALLVTHCRQAAKYGTEIRDSGRVLFTCIACYMMTSVMRDLRELFDVGAENTLDPDQIAAFYRKSPLFF